MNRKMMLTTACLLWSVMTGLQALATGIWLIYLCRFLVGVFQAACNPPAYSIMADYFHPKYRTRATSIYSLGIYLGGALSSLSGLIISGAGWRWTFAIMGIIGVAAGIFGFVIIREPPRNNFDPKKAEVTSDKPAAVVRPSPMTQFGRASAEIFINPTCRWVVIAGSFRFFGGYAIGYYMPSYFGSVYKDNKNLYFTLNAFVVSVGGFASAMTGGYLSDSLEAKHPRIKAIVCM
jgi:MFS family permease